MMLQSQNIPYQKINFSDDIQIDVKRIDLAHPTISGNKFYKLKYNLLEAKQQGFDILVSFGGAYSNHIFALAHAAHAYGFKSIGMIRGEELKHQPLNPTLQNAQDLGMQLEFLSRSQYREKHTPEFLAQLQAQYPNSYIIPEGGTNSLALKGCEEILSDDDKQHHDIICCAVGTGGTISGIINASHDHQTVLGFSALKGDFLSKEIQQWTTKNNWQIIEEDYFGGYGKFNGDLLNFIKDIKQQSNIPFDPIYTGKMLYRLKQLIDNKQFKSGTRILLIHTGGLQAFPNL